MTDRPKPPAAGRGRKRGSMNRHTKTAKLAIAQFVADNAPGAQKLFDRLSRTDPRGALEMLAVFTRFVLPVNSKVDTSISEGRAITALDIGISFANGGPGMPLPEEGRTSKQTYYQSDRTGVYVTPPHPDPDAETPDRVVLPFVAPPEPHA
jgi:hypothetical protein